MKSITVTPYFYKFTRGEQFHETLSLVALDHQTPLLSYPVVA